MKHALVLCSGGIDSVTVAYLAKKKNPSSLTLLFYAYGQPQEIHERLATKYHARKLQAHYVEIELPALAHLTKRQQRIPKKHAFSLHNTKKEGLQWFIPGRNTLFIAHALAYIESQYTPQEKIDVYLGFKNEGKDSFSDTTQEYVKRMQSVLNQASHHQIILKTPLILLDKEDIITKGKRVGINYTLTWSCYQPLRNTQCGLCLACRLRKEGFKWADMNDPTVYAP